MWFQRYQTEWAKILRKWGIILFLLSFFILGFPLLKEEMNYYKTIYFEKIFTSLHAPTFGVKGIAIPSPLLILFPSTPNFNAPYSEGTATAKQALTKLRLYHHHNDVPKVFYILGSLFMLYMGASAFPSDKYFFFFQNIFIRLFHLLLLITVFMMFWRDFVCESGIAFSSWERTLLYFYFFFVLLTYSFFYAVGVFLRVIFRTRSTTYISAIIGWFASLFIIPVLLGMLFQQQTLNSLPPLPFTNIDQENALIVKKNPGLTKKYEKLQALYPTSYFTYLTNHIITHEGSAIPTKPHWANESIKITLSYICLLFLLSYLIIRKRGAYPKNFVLPSFQHYPGNSYFVLCQDNTLKNNLAMHYHHQKSVMVLDNPEAPELDTGLSLLNIAEYFLNYLEADNEQFLENLAILGLSISKLQAKRHMSKTERQTKLLKIYAAAVMACHQNLIVVNDFLKGKPAEMEETFLQLASQANRSGKTVVFLSSTIFNTALPTENKQERFAFFCVKIVPTAVSMR